ncbi:MAG: DUF1624 domain-containing protein [Ruminococcaceae bacterium]|nr:DUF1624 domain-containing protein [Oscillospiraceae bacterium]
MSNSRRRIALLDELRGFLVLCMIFYHAFIFMYEQYDIVFGYKAYNFFLPVQPHFSCMFIFICGICCNLSHNNLKRGLKILIIALALNFITIIILPKLSFVNTAIYFGILNFFSISLILYALLEKFLTKIPPFVGILLSLFFFWLFRFWRSSGTISLWKDISYTVPDSAYEIKWLFPLGIQSPEFFSADYFPLIPFIFIFFLGAFFGVWIKKGCLPSFAYQEHSKFLSWLGQNCLIVFLIHLPILYVILEFYTWVVSHI